MPMYKKRIIHRPAGFMFKYVNDTDSIRIKSAPPQTVEPRKSEGVELLLPNGLPLTKEMIEAIEFDDSSESTEETNSNTNTNGNMNSNTNTNSNTSSVHLSATVDSNKSPALQKNERDKEKMILHKVLKSKERVPIKITKESVLCQENIRNVKVESKVSTEKVLPTQTETVHESPITEQPVTPQTFDSSSSSVSELYVYAPVEKKKDKKCIKYTIEEILNAEQHEIFINFDKSLLKKRESIAEKFRLEMNRIAWSNAEDVIKTVKYLKVSKQEVKIMAEILFEKAITEETFSILYVYFLKNMKDFFYQGELKEKEDEWNARLMQKVNFEEENNYPILKEDPLLNRSYFFNTFMILCQNFIQTKREWKVSKYDEDKSLSFEEQSIKSERFEELEYERNKIKEKEIGLVRLVCIMFVNEVVSKKIMGSMIKVLLRREDDIEKDVKNDGIKNVSNGHEGIKNEEHKNDANTYNLRDEDIELLCSIINSVAYELHNALPKYFNAISNEFERIVKIVKQKRIKFMILDCIDEMKLIMKGKIKKSSFIDTRICEEKKEFRKYKVEYKNDDIADGIYAPPIQQNIVKKKLKSDFHYVEFGSDKMVQTNKNRSKSRMIGKKIEINENEVVTIKTSKEVNTKQFEGVDEKVDIKNDNVCTESENNNFVLATDIVTPSVVTTNSDFDDSAYKLYSDLSLFDYPKSIVDEFDMYEEEEEIEMVNTEIHGRIENNEITLENFSYGFLYYLIQKKEVTKKVLLFLCDYIKNENNATFTKTLSALSKKVEELQLDIPKAKANFDFCVLFFRSKAMIKKEVFVNFDIAHKEKVKFGKELFDDKNKIAIERIFGSVEEYELTKNN